MIENIIRLPQPRFKPKSQITSDLPILTSFQEAKEIFILNCKTKNLSNKTVSWYEEKLKYFSDYLYQNYPEIELNSITPDIIKSFIFHLQRKEHAKIKGKLLSSYTIGGVVRVIKIFFKFLTEEGYIQVNPCERIDIPKVQKKIIKPLSEVQIKNLLSVPNLKTFTGFRNYLIILIFLDTGIRLSELVNLKIRDIDWERYILFILGKGNKEREVPFGRLVAKALLKYLKWRGEIPGQDYIFVDKFGEKMKPRHIEKIIGEYGKKAGIEKLHPHLFRHTFALFWIKSGGDIFSLQRILGHSSLDMVRNYVNLASEDISLKHHQFGLVDKLGLSRR
jgi:integrase/recombinase XerD